MNRKSVEMNINKLFRELSILDMRLERHLFEKDIHVTRAKQRIEKLEKAANIVQPFDAMVSSALGNEIDVKLNGEDNAEPFDQIKARQDVIEMLHNRITSGDYSEKDLEVFMRMTEY